MEPWKCVRCGHKWYGRNPNVKPSCCARCKTLYWDRPARTPKPRIEPQCVGRAEKYGFSVLQVGGSKIVPWNVSEDRSLIYPAAMSYARRKGWKIKVDVIPGQGLLIKRFS